MRFQVRLRAYPPRRRQRRNPLSETPQRDLQHISSVLDNETLLSIFEYMSASTPLFEATIEPDEDPFPSGNIGSTGRPRSDPVVLTPGPANSINNNNAVSGIQGGNPNDAEMGIVSDLAMIFSCKGSQS